MFRLFLVFWCVFLAPHFCHDIKQKLFRVVVNQWNALTAFCGPLIIARDGRRGLLSYLLFLLGSHLWGSWVWLIKNWRATTLKFRHWRRKVTSAVWFHSHSLLSETSLESPIDRPITHGVKKKKHEFLSIEILWVGLCKNVTQDRKFSCNRGGIARLG